MTTNEFNELLDYCLVQIKERALIKNKEYGSDADALESVKKSAIKANLSPLRECLALQAKHLASIDKIVEKPMIWTNEHIEEKVFDVIVWELILFMLLTEERK